MDARTRAEKLRAMADQDASPHEAAIAAAKLQEMGAGGRQPPRRPPAAPAPGTWPSWSYSWSPTGTSTTTVPTAWATVWFDVS